MPANASLTLKRRLKASPAKVYQAWTDPKMMIHWWSPAEFETLIAEADPRGPKSGGPPQSLKGTLISSVS